MTEKPRKQPETVDAPAGGFVLVVDDKTMGPTELANAIERKTGRRVSTQTIRNHADKGTISGTKGPKGWRFKTSAIEEWVRNRPPPKHGGVRKNGGKRRNDPLPSSTLTGDVTRARDAANEIREQLASDEDGNLPDPPVNAMRLEDVLRCTKEQLEAIVSFRARRELLDASQISRLEDLTKLQLSELKLAKEKGELIEAREIRAAWLEEQNRIASMIIDLAKQIAPRIAAACWVTDQHRHRICSMLKEYEVDPELITAVSHELAEPPELTGRARSIVDDGIRKVMAEVAEPPEEND